MCLCGCDPSVAKSAALIPSKLYGTKMSWRQFLGQKQNIISVMQWHIGVSLNTSSGISGKNLCFNFRDLKNTFYYC